MKGGMGVESCWFVPGNKASVGFHLLQKEEEEEEEKEKEEDNKKSLFAQLSVDLSVNRTSITVGHASSCEITC